MEQLDPLPEHYCSAARVARVEQLDPLPEHYCSSARVARVDPPHHQSCSWPAPGHADLRSETQLDALVFIQKETKTVCTLKK